MTHSQHTTFVLQRLFQFLFCLGLLFLCLLAALALTLWRAPYLIFWMDRTDYPEALNQGMRTSCIAYADAYDLPQAPLLDCWDQSLLRQELIRSVDETFHQLGPGRSSPFDDLAESIAQQTGVPRADVIGACNSACNDLAALWHKAVQPPFANLLNLLMQYRRISPGLVCLFLVLVLGSLAMLYSMSENWRALAASLLPIAKCLLLCGLLIPLLAALLWSRWNWVPTENLALHVFRGWSVGFFVCWVLLTLAAGLGCLVLGTHLHRLGRPAQQRKIHRRTA